MHGLIYSQSFTLRFLGIMAHLRYVIHLLTRRNRRNCRTRMLWWLAFQGVLTRPGADVRPDRIRCWLGRTGGGGLRFGWRPGHHDTLNCEKYSTKGEPAMPEVSFARKIAGVS